MYSLDQSTLFIQFILRNDWWTVSELELVLKLMSIRHMDSMLGYRQKSLK